MEQAKRSNCPGLKVSLAPGQTFGSLPPRAFSGQTPRTVWGSPQSASSDGDGAGLGLGLGRSSAQNATNGTNAMNGMSAMNAMNGRNGMSLEGWAGHQAHQAHQAQQRHQNHRENGAAMHPSGWREPNGAVESVSPRSRRYEVLDKRLGLEGRMHSRGGGVFETLPSVLEQKPRHALIGSLEALVSSNTHQPQANPGRRRLVRAHPNQNQVRPALWLGHVAMIVTHMSRVGIQEDRFPPHRPGRWRQRRSKRPKRFKRPQRPAHRHFERRRRGAAAGVGGSADRKPPAAARLGMMDT